LQHSEFFKIVTYQNYWDQKCTKHKKTIQK